MRYSKIKDSISTWKRGIWGEKEKEKEKMKQKKTYVIMQVGGREI
jgi:hypothetical protein